MIWLHGLDDTAENWANGLAGARARHPTWRWLFVRAPERAITAYDGRLHLAWGDFHEAGAVRVGSRDYDGKRWYAESIASVHAAVRTLVADGVPPRKIAIVGFSQGAALAAAAALTLETPIGGWAMLAGWLLPAAREALRAGAKSKAAAAARPSRASSAHPKLTWSSREPWTTSDGTAAAALDLAPARSASRAAGSSQPASIAQPPIGVSRVSAAAAASAAPCEKPTMAILRGGTPSATRVRTAACTAAIDSAYQRLPS